MTIVDNSKTIVDKIDEDFYPPGVHILEGEEIE